MANFIVPTELQNLNAIQLQQTPLLAKVLPVLNLGQIMPLTVRQNPADGQGQGLIFFQGQNIPAQLPENLQTGQRVMVQVAGLGDKVVLKLLDGLKPQPSQSQLQSPVLDNLATQLQNFSKQTGAPTLGPLEPFTLPQSVQLLTSQNENITKLLTTLTDSTTLQDPQKALETLVKLHDGNFAQTLKTAAKDLNLLLDHHSMPVADRSILSLYNELSRIWHSGSESEPEAMRQLKFITDWLQKAVDDPQADKTQARETLREVLSQLKNGLANPKELNSALEKALSALGQNAEVIEQSIKSQLDPQTVANLREFAVRLEQMGNIQDTLHKLNPMMQALGEPALILFPFLFQGLVSHTELTVDNTYRKKKKSSGDGESSGKGRGDGSEPYHRVQISVPLPSLGQIEVDVLHRSKEIYVQLTTEQPEVAEFLLEQLEYLSATLRDQGFEKAQLIAHTGPSTDISPAWAETLRTKTSILA